MWNFFNKRQSSTQLTSSHACMIMQRYSCLSEHPPLPHSYAHLIHLCFTLQEVRNAIVGYNLEGLKIMLDWWASILYMPMTPCSRFLPTSLIELCVKASLVSGKNIVLYQYLAIIELTWLGIEKWLLFSWIGRFQKGVYNFQSLLDHWNMGRNHKRRLSLLCGFPERFVRGSFSD